MRIMSGAAVWQKTAGHGIRQHTMSNSIKPNRQYALIKKDMSISALIWAKRLQKVRSI